jgi:O-antigen/teichoic acid export membrane protein
MTTKVVKGSMWTLAGSVLPLGVSFISTPFIIRFLGAESYGVLLLVGLIPTYFSFADFGMGIASTKFASEAYGQGDRVKEAEFVWTAAAIAAAAAMVIAVPIFIFSRPIVTALNVPEYLLGQASAGLKITSAGFVIGIIASVINSPMLARLRMDLSTVTASGPRIVLALVTPFVLYFGGGILGAVIWSFMVNVCAFAVVFYFSYRLLPSLIRPAIRREHLRPLFRFGAGLVIGGIAAILLVNFEKLALTQMVSVKALAYYSVAFTFAGMATMFSSSMLQTLVPAFSQLLEPHKKSEFDTLFVRGMRMNLIVLLPGVVFLFVIAKPFFTLWAGEDFGRESSLPFYFLLFGLFFNILAYIPSNTITARGRTDIFAKLYWIELVLYAVLVVVLISKFGIVGAAAAWSLRVILDAFVIMWLARRVAGVPFGFVRDSKGILLAAAALLPAIALGGFYDTFSLLVGGVTALCLAVYAVIVWKAVIQVEERNWILLKLKNLPLLRK